MFFYLSGLLFLGFLQFKGNFYVVKRTRNTVSELRYRCNSGAFLSLSSVVQRWTVHDQKWLGSSQEAGVPDYGESTGRKEDWGRKTSRGSCSWAQGTGEESADKRGGQCTRIEHNWLMSSLRLFSRRKPSFSRVAKNKRKSTTFTGLLLSEWPRLRKLKAKCIYELICTGKYMYGKTEIIYLHWFLYHLAFIVQGKYFSSSCFSSLILETLRHFVHLRVEIKHLSLYLSVIRCPSQPLWISRFWTRNLLISIPPTLFVYDSSWQ